MPEVRRDHQPDVSVVVPVYNVELYLAQCLDSVLNQVDVELEVLCIDDCGTDGSYEILKAYQARDPRIRIVSHAENRGLSAARNTGIENARGKFIVFLDSDDLLNADKLAVQVAAIRRDDADMVYFHTDLLWERFPGDPSPSVCANPPEFVLFNQELRRTNLLSYPALLHATSSWSYIYSADFLRRNDIRFDEHLKRWEDRAFWTRVARLANTVSIVPVAARKYRQRSESITKGAQDPEHLWMMLQQLNIILDEFELFRNANKESDTSVHTTYLHSYIAFRVTSWFLNAVKSMEDPRCQEDLLRGAVELFRRLDWQTVDLRSVENFTRRLQIDVDRTVLLCGLLRKDRVARVLQFFDVERLPLQDILEAEGLFDNAYYISRKRFEEAPTDMPESADVDSPYAEEWMNTLDLVVHIGFRKTGTTYVQRTFDLNRELLLSHGVLFPNSGLDRTDDRGGRPGACAGHLGFIELVRNHEKRRKLWHEVRQEIGERKINTLFVSAENFLHEYSTINLQKLRRAFSGFRQLHFIVSLRRPDRWIESLYKELVCGGWRGEVRTFDSFVKDEWQQMDFAARLAPWIEEFGIERFDAISVDSRNDDLDGAKAVLEVLRKRTAAMLEPESVSGWCRLSDAEAYPSPKAELVEAIRLLNAAKRPSAAYRREVTWLIEKWNGSEDVFDFSLLSSDMKARIEAEMMPKYVNLLRRFGMQAPCLDTVQVARGPSVNAGAITPLRVNAMLMEDVIRASRKLPDQDHVHHFFRRFYSKGMPKAAPAAAPRISLRERLIAALILKPTVAVWNLASQDTKDALRMRAKTAFGSGYVDRIVRLARKTSGQAAGR